MTSNTITQQPYELQQSMLPMQRFIPQQIPAPPAYPAYPAIQPAGLPVYNSVPYRPVYGNPGIPPYQPQQCMPDISTVKIELNGLQPPVVPGFNNPPQLRPTYPGMTQVVPYQYQQIPMAPQMMMPPVQIPQPPRYVQQMPMAPQMMMPPAQIPQSPRYVQQMPAPGMIVPPQVMPQGVTVPPPAQYVVPPQPQIVPPPPAVNNVVPAAPAISPQDTRIKPLLDAVAILSFKPGKTEASIEEQGNAIQTIAQFARVIEAADQLSIKDPNNPEVKKTNEEINTIIKPNLIKEDTFLALTDMALKDTSGLTGEQKAKADENRIMSMWTLSLLQKIFKKEMNAESTKAGLPLISMTEVPGIVQIKNLVIGNKEKNIAPDSNAGIREAGISALTHLADPNDAKDKETMKIILAEITTEDSNEDVKLAAISALSAITDPNNDEDKAYMMTLLGQSATEDSSEKIKQAATEALAPYK